MTEAKPRKVRSGWLPDPEKLWPAVVVPTAEEFFYPSGDGEPVAESTLQYEWIATIKGGLEELFVAREDVFVAADLFWYPVEGDNQTRVAPDVLVVFGRPGGHRLSYLQWREDGLAPHVVFEIVSVSNRWVDLMRKFAFYERYGVQEYYSYDPNPRPGAPTGPLALTGWRRSADGGRLEEIPAIAAGWRSPLLEVTMTCDAHGGLHLVRPDGLPFRTWLETVRAREQEAARAEQERARADEAQVRADEAQARAEQAQARADEVQARADEVQARVEVLAARLRAAGLDPDLP